MKFFLLILSTSLIFSLTLACSNAPQKIGVIYATHGGHEKDTEQHMWDAVLHQFSYDKNHPINVFVMWHKKNWKLILNSPMSDYAVSFRRKYGFEYARIGGKDP